MAFDTNSDTMARDETYDLISSEKVDGTAVYNRDGERLGTYRGETLVHASLAAATSRLRSSRILFSEAPEP
mgnify:CR=1 FL=1